MKTALKIALLTCLVGWGGGVSAKEIAAPFGLTWGMSKADMEALGMHISSCTNFVEWKGQFMHRGSWFSDADRQLTTTVCFMRNPPKPLSIAEYYTVQFNSRKGLVYVDVDIHFFKRGQDEGKTFIEYLRLKPGLIKKYGTPLLDNKELCTSSGCVLISTWTDGAGGYMSLTAIPTGGDFGVLQLAYESKEWTQLVDDIKARKDAADAERTAGDDDAL